MSAARHISTASLTALIAAACTLPAAAQTTGSYYQPVSVGPAYTVGPRHSSTALEGALRGRAQVIDALGRYRVNDAQANILNQQAQTLAYENDVKKTETLYRKKYLWRQHRENERAREIERDSLGKELLTQRQATYYRDTYTLDSDQFNRNTGKLSWPAPLRDDQFAATRSQLDFLFRQRSRYGAGSDDPFAGRILKLTEQLKQDLKEELTDMEASDYADAQKFVRGLIYEVQYPVEVG
ncbi:hypothetical protein Pla123a_02170 [Posidoniimonas polymericola]|uniref:Uncharacterized protein n=1 Tax=Posidoniimonas polymericola TaxID=2528002 RepID=A0A5C5ZE25_9BACT|nr:hypothetical protein [Posidoniimonas polymericola]TWT85410.1 hypothetical protein Pla123a_02170 [Posidoniimonas polymericola]